MSGRPLASVTAAWAIPAFALVTVGLGLTGWLEHGYRLDNALYRAMALFSIANEVYRGVPGTTDWHFLVGRWTGLMSVFGAAVFTVGALLHKQAVVSLAQLVRQEVIVFGSQGIAAKAFDAARGAEKTAVWIGASAVEAISVRLLALPWPADDNLKTLATYAVGADHILLAREDDASALALAQAVRAAAPTALITLLLRDTRLAEDAAAMISQPRTRVLSTATVAARALHIDHAPFVIARGLGHPRIHALIVGFGQTGQAIARDLIVNCRTTYLALPRITVVDPQAKALEGVMRVRAPELDACAEFTFIEGALGTQGVEPDIATLGRTIGAGGPVTVAYVARDADAEGLSAAGMLQSLLRATDLGEPPIFVRLSDVHMLSRTAGGQGGFNALIPFGDLQSIIAATEFLSETPDSAARAFSEAYRSLLPAEKRVDPTLRSNRPWDSLDETFRQATRDAVAHIPAKLASAGVDPVLWLGKAGPPQLPRDVQLFANEAECERLAELEHERWNAQRRMDGWRWADVLEKDEHRRVHPNLIAYDQLSEDTKAYDRAIARETQLICWSSGAPPPRL
jgi:hypothetical protein